MKKFLRIVMIGIGVIVLLIAILLTYVKTALPNVGAAPELTIELTKERIERGQYLANSVAVCMDCHSSRDWTKFAGPMVPGTEGQGGEAFTQKYGFPGNFYAKNITPASLKGWTDGELVRLITTGVTKDGNAIFPVMPYHNYGKMTTEDIYSIVAYIRTLKPIEHTVPERSIDFPMNFIINTIPMAAAPAPSIPDTSDIIAYGAYMLNAAGCGECHTKQDKGQKIAGMEFAGGFEFPMGAGVIVRSSNITPHETGIGGWSKEQFIQRFLTYADSSYTPGSVKEGTFNTVMPWMMYKNMKRQDLAAIYEYLRTVKPVANDVEKVSLGVK